MLNTFESPSVDLADFGDHTGLKQLITEAGFHIEDTSYFFSPEKDEDDQSFQYL